MKTIVALLVVMVFAVISPFTSSFAQTPKRAIEDKKLHVVTKNDGSKYIGEILQQDAREVLILTKTLGEVVIPKHEIRSIEEVDATKIKGDEIVEEELFATRYFLTTNGLPIKKNESYMQLNLFGPDFQFGVAKNFGVGVITTWFATPIIGTAKYTFRLSENVHAGGGLLLGTGSWTFPDFALALPYASVTFGNRLTNFTFSSGYGGVWYKEESFNPVTRRSTTVSQNEGRLLFSVASIMKIAPKVTFVFDSFLMPQGPLRSVQSWQYQGQTDSFRLITTEERSSSLYVFVPGLRWQTDHKRAFQFGFAGFIFDGDALEVPIPMISWFRKI